MPTPIRVFISYRHESVDYARLIVRLANQFREGGIDAIIDQFVSHPKEGWPRWTLNELEKASFVICCCSSTYSISFEGHNYPGKGLGVNAEGFHIAQELFETGHQTEKYIPIVFKKDLNGRKVNDLIPKLLRPFRHYILPEEYNMVYSQIIGQTPVYQAPLGKIHQALNQQQSESFFKKKQETLISYHGADDQFIKNLAPEEGVFISKYLRKKREDKPHIIWLASKGDQQYTFDSLTIESFVKGLAGPITPVIREVDVSYTIYYDVEEDQIEPLLPAISLGPVTKNFACISINTINTRASYAIYHTRFTLNYHTSNGKTGTLFFYNVPEIEIKVANAIKEDVNYLMLNKEEAPAYLIASSGQQKGLEMGKDYRYNFFCCAFLSLGENINAQTVEAYQRKVQSLVNKKLALAKKLNSNEELKNYLIDYLFHQSGHTLLFKEAADFFGMVIDLDELRNLSKQYETELHRKILLIAAVSKFLVTQDDEVAEFCLSFFSDHFSSLKLHDYRNEYILELLILILVLKPNLSGKILIYLKNNLREGYSDFVKHGFVKNYLTSLVLVFKRYISSNQSASLIDPVKGPFDEDLYLLGTMNNWEPIDSFRLTYIGDFTYQVSCQLDHGDYQFKITDKNWSKQFDFGAKYFDTHLSLDKPFTLFRDFDVQYPYFKESSKNLMLHLHQGVKHELNFFILVQDIDRPILNIIPSNSSSLSV